MVVPEHTFPREQPELLGEVAACRARAEQHGAWSVVRAPSTADEGASEGPASPNHVPKAEAGAM